jgi:secreted trypsin-like serine protease
MIGQNVRYAENGEFDFIVSILKTSTRRINVDRDFLCTGTLVSQKHVLTVEHCFQFVTVEFSEVHIGSNDLRLGNVFYPERLISYFVWATHRRKRLSQRHDIAIVKVNLSDL